MVSASKHAVERATPAAPAGAIGRSVAHLSARVSAYFVDSIVLFAFILVFFVIAGLQLLIADSRTAGDPSDAAFYAFAAIVLGGSLIAWSAFNLALMRWRGQTMGMYVIGIKTVSEDGTALTTGRTLLRWFGLHPLLFHPLLLPIWLILSYLIFAATPSRAALAITLVPVLLCLVAPVVSLSTALLDRERRALHDRLAHTLVVHIETR